MNMQKSHKERDFNNINDFTFRCKVLDSENDCEFTRIIFKVPVIYYTTKNKSIKIILVILFTNILY